MNLWNIENLSFNFLISWWSRCILLKWTMNFLNRDDFKCVRKDMCELLLSRGCHGFPWCLWPIKKKCAGGTSAFHSELLLSCGCHDFPWYLWPINKNCTAGTSAFCCTACTVYIPLMLVPLMSHPLNSSVGTLWALWSKGTHLLKLYFHVIKVVLTWITCNKFQNFIIHFI